LGAGILALYEEKKAPDPIAITTFLPLALFKFLNNLICSLLSADKITGVFSTG
jgi:hypothetical protein